MPTIRLATVDDADTIRRIYAPFCEDDNTVSFEIEPPSLAEMSRRIAKTLERYPWLVCDDGGAILGYVYGSAHGERAAYRWSADVSVYIADGCRGMGIGRALYTSLFALLKLQGYVSVFAGTVLPNDPSIGLHRSMGFEPVGIYRDVGFKAGTWLDTAWWQRSLGEKPPCPEPTLTLIEAQQRPEWGPAIEAGLPWLRPR